MTQYKETKRKIEKILGVKAKGINRAYAACSISNEKYTIYLFKTEETEYEEYEGKQYEIPDRVSYYAVETGSKLPVSWHYPKKNGPWDQEKWLGFTNHIEREIISPDTIDENLMWALYNCEHLGHYFTEKELLDD